MSSARRLSNAATASPLNDSEGVFMQLCYLIVWIRGTRLNRRRGEAVAWLGPISRNAGAAEACERRTSWPVILRLKP